MKILISHISVDRSLFDFTGNKDEFDIPELAENITVQVSAYQSGGSYTFTGKINTKLKLKCDRCLELYEQTIDQNFNVVFTSEDNVDKDDHIMYLSPQDVEIDLKPYVSDTLMLNIPFKKICSENCKGFCANCGINLNHQKCICSKEKTDPRWDSLKELKKTLESAEE
ncbi:MAG: DUF177 domain-containing protein [Candidatus Marinimicrobia bacterium]|nr:DUF177 domain-containing protein [Candidatus Neomarinimicrobiota bacterium]